MIPHEPRDLFVVVADLDAENAVKTLLCERQKALGVEIRFNPDHIPHGDLLRYSGRDAGCRTMAVELLRPQRECYRHALLLFDRHGCGADNRPREGIERELEVQLEKNGWENGRAAVIVIDPELEIWVWSESPHVAGALGWGNDHSGLKSFLFERGLWRAGQAKPHRPKEAMREACRRKRVALESPIFADLASNVGLRGCTDSAFKKFRNCLRRWFPSHADRSQRTSAF